MKKSSIIKFTRKCLKSGYKEQVCKDAWIFGKTQNDELKKIYKEAFKGEKNFVLPYSLGRKTRSLKYKNPKTVTRKMLLGALGPRFEKVV